MHFADDVKALMDECSDPVISQPYRERFSTKPLFQAIRYLLFALVRVSTTYSFHFRFPFLLFLWLLLVLCRLILETISVL